MSKKVRSGDRFGIDLDKLIAWQFLPYTPDDTAPRLKLFISGKSLTIKQADVGEPGFSDLHDRLIEEFDNDVVRTRIPNNF